MKRNTDHVVWDLRTQEMRCDNCGQRYKPNLPAPLDMVTKMMKSFMAMHKNCRTKIPKGES